VVVKYVCDADSQRAEEGASLVEGATGKAAQPIHDFRKILDDKEVDALICAAPNHWHAPATILACAAGKHVYVEKPCSHNPREGVPGPVGVDVLYPCPRRPSGSRRRRAPFMSLWLCTNIQLE
jgi:hypothetical protein